MDAGIFELFDVLTKKSYKIIFWELSTRVHETVEKMSSALDRVQRLESKVHRDVVRESVLGEENRVVGGLGYLVLDSACLFLRKASEVVEEQK